MSTGLESIPGGDREAIGQHPTRISSDAVLSPSQVVEDQVMPASQGSDRQRKVYPYLFIAPFFAVFLVFTAFPVLFTLAASFTTWKGFGAMTFVGLQNYVDLVSDKIFLKAMVNTVTIMVIVLPIEVATGLVLAHTLNSYFSRSKHIFQTIYFVPFITSPVVVGLLFSVVFDYRFGLVNWALQTTGLIDVGLDWLGDPRFAKPVISAAYLWRGIGYTTVIFIAGLQTISQEYYESAIIDGAGPVTVFFRIVLPLLKPVIAFIVITTIIQDLQLFAEPFLLFRHGGTENSGTTIMTYLYHSAFRFNRSGYGAAISYTLFFMILFFSMSAFRLFTRGDDNG